ncbi:thiol reductase thioredoxin [Herbaspirillum sp. meg3]|uniref:thioredoxin family protein n=1 Tax=Herbaspirillum sp. meg3 TaxID=2025949 RepID=UPI000B98D261|nr:thioredoxin family protein [Herbaspirillum sp. meg3]ASU41520.1 thiol reductase thioredoxin [Herbaspirillum sp. meg3]
MKILKTLAVFLLLQAGVASTVFAAGQHYAQAQFDALNKSGKPVVVHVHADWCPTCRAQDPIVSALIKDPAFKNVSFLEVDFDAQKDVVKAFNVTQQSTLIVFKGGKEVGRSTGDTRKASIDSLINKAL